MLTMNICAHTDLWDEWFPAKQKLIFKYDLLNGVNIIEHPKDKIFSNY